MRAPRGRLIGRRPRAPSPALRAATRRTPRIAALLSSSSSSLPPPRDAPTARPCVSVAPSSPRSPRPSYYAAVRSGGSSSSVRPTPPRSNRCAPPTRSSSVSCSSPTPTGTTPSSRRGQWRTPSWCDESALPPDRYPATLSAVSRSRTRLLIDFIWKFSGSHLADNAGALEHTRESFHLLYFCKLVFLEASPFAYATLLPISNCEFCVLEE